MMTEDTLLSPSVRTQLGTALSAALEDAFRTGFQIAREMAAAEVRAFLFDSSPGLQERIRSLTPTPRALNEVLQPTDRGTKGANQP